jgi:hypothetical protein
MKKIINLTPHEVVVYDGNMGIIGRYPSDGVARARATYESDDKSVNGVPLVHVTFGDPVDLPDPVDGTMYIVSLITAQAAESVGRITSDLLITAQPVRDESGQIIGCTAFTQL